MYIILNSSGRGQRQDVISLGSTIFGVKKNFVIVELKLYDSKRYFLVRLFLYGGFVIILFKSAKQNDL